MLIVDIDAPVYTILDVNNEYLMATNTEREDLIGKSVFSAFPGNPTDNVSKNIEHTIFSFEQAIKNKVPHVMSNYRYDIPIPGSTKFEERYWTTSNVPVLDENGEVRYFIHSPLHTFPGLGLGLYISSEIIKREGGRIWVNSWEGKGSTFCFSLPVITGKGQNK